MVLERLPSPPSCVSELERATQRDQQDLLTYLITMEYENLLVTKGPFNSIFTRRKAEGFSIDCKPENRTLLASGLILVKVLAGKEPALVCLDLRAGRKVDAFRFGIRA